MKPRTLTFVLGALFAGAAATSLAFPPRARVYPFWVAVAGVLACVASWISADASEQSSGPAFKSIAPYLTWVIALLGGITLVGLPAAATLFVAIFLHREGEVTKSRALAAGLAAGVGLVLVGSVLGLRWPWALLDVAASLGVT